MEVKAHAKFLRLSPRKARLVVDTVRGEGALEAISKLNLAPHKAAREVVKIINSAMANAEHNFGLSKNELFIKEITADQGPTFKRYKPRARGSADEIKRRMTHLTVILASLEKGKGKPQKEVKETLKEVPKTEKVQSEKEELKKTKELKPKLKAKEELEESKTKKPVSETKKTEPKVEKKEVSKAKTTTPPKKTQAVKKDIKKIKEEEIQQKGKVKVQKESFFGGLRKMFRRKGF